MSKNGHPISCPSGYIDHTNGHAHWWQCGKEKSCPGSFPWSDADCGCACVLPSECIMKVPGDDCVTQAEMSGMISHTSQNPTSTSLFTSASASSTFSHVPTHTTVTTSIPTYRPQTATQSSGAQSFMSREPQTQDSETKDKSGSTIIAVLCIVVILAVGFCILFACIGVRSMSDYGLRGDPPVIRHVQTHPQAPVHERVLPQPRLPNLLSSNVPLDRKLTQPAKPSGAWVDGLSMASTRTPSPSGDSLRFTLSPVPCPSPEGSSTCSSASRQGLDSQVADWHHRPVTRRGVAVPGQQLEHAVCLNSGLPMSNPTLSSDRSEGQSNLPTVCKVPPRASKLAGDELFSEGRARMMVGLASASLQSASLPVHLPRRSPRPGPRV